MPRTLDADELAAYQRDGAVKLPAAVDPVWVARLHGVVDAQLAAPSQWANDTNRDASRDRLFTDRYQWRHNETIRRYVFESGVARLAAEAMQSSTCRFYFDHILVKEPGTVAETPWHQDLPYWPFKGRQICSVWLALTDVTIEESAMEFVRGSHLDGKVYLPELFGKRDGHPSSWINEGSGEPVPAIEERRDDFDIVGWDMRAGDAVLFSAWILHWAPGNASATKRRAALSTRWLGDDATWYPHAGRRSDGHPGRRQPAAGRTGPRRHRVSCCLAAGQVLKAGPSPASICRY